MDCPSCGLACMLGSTKCGYCGRLISAATASAPAVTQRSPVMSPAATPRSPIRPAHTRSLPTAAAPSAPSYTFQPKRRPRRKIRIGTGTKMALILGTGVVLLGGLIVLKILQPPDKLDGAIKVNETVTLLPGEMFAGRVESGGKYDYEFEVICTEGSFTMAFGKVGNMEKPTAAEMKAIEDSAKPVKEATSESMKGKITPGSYIWWVRSAEEKKSSSARVNFLGR